MIKHPLILTLSATILIITAPTFAADLHVPSVYPTIQGAIDDANNGDTVIIADGTYTGDGNRDIDFLGKAITVRSENGPENCIIDCKASYYDNHRGFYFHNNEDANSILDGLTITRGDSSEAGAILCQDSGPTINNCFLIDNFGVYVIMFDGDSTATITNSTINDNDTAGIYCGLYTTVTITGCTITNNSTYYSQWLNYPVTSPPGGILALGNTSITNCIISGNSTYSEGGGINCYKPDYLPPTITSIKNCTITNNTSRRSGGGISSVYADHITITNSIIWNNSAPSGPQITAEYALSFPYPSTIDISYSNIQGGQEQMDIALGIIFTWGPSNIDTDPLFALSDDYHLTASSPCVDTGTNDPNGGLPSIDADGNSRPLDGDGNANAIADIGAYEFNPDSPCIALSPTILHFTCDQNGPNPEPQTILIRNSAASTLSWQISEDCPWLDLDTANGTSTGEIDTVTVSIDNTSLTRGFYRCVLTVYDTNAVNSPRNIQIILYVSGTISVPSQFPTIQAAIDAAWHGDTVIIADGTYTGEGNYNIDFLGKAITVKSENGPQNCIIDCNGSEEYNRSGFYFSRGEDANSIVDGFTITNGYLSGIYCLDGGPTITNCIITGNTTPAFYFPVGSAISGSQGPVINCTITDNTSEDCGAITDCEGPIINCTIKNNSGGGISYCTGPIIGCEITGNRAPYFGGIYLCPGPIINCTIVGNFSENEYFVSGGGLSNCGGPIINCIIRDNRPENLQIYENAMPAYSCLPNGANDVGSINSDPCFVSPGYWDANGTPNDANDDFWIDGDYHLKSDSSCIDAGNYAYHMTMPLADLDGNTRLSGTQIDIGCYEYGSSPDTDGDWLCDTDETTHGTNSNLIDSDNDGLLDGIEVLGQTEPLIPDPLRPWQLPADANSIQQALFFSRSGETITLNEGTYYENLYLGGRNIILTSTNPNDPNIVAATIINGDTDANSQTPNGPVISLARTEDPSCLINGLTITNGSNGGITSNNYNSLPMKTGSLATISNCIITNNECGYGGGLSNCDGTITNCVISNNIAGGGGGMAYCDGPISNCTISNNIAGWHGGGLLSCLGPVTDSVIADNIADDYGGGIGIDYSNPYMNLENASLTNCLITGNLANFGGGGVSSYPGPINNCVILANFASNGGGLYDCYDSITNCLIAGNTADYGGGLYACLEPIINCTITNNRAAVSGGGIYLNAKYYYTNSLLTNSILTNNTAPSGPQISLYPHSWRSDYDPIITVSYSDIQGGQADIHLEDPNCTLIWDVGNIDVDPCFIDPGYWDNNDTPADFNDDIWIHGDYHLLLDSLCIDTGDPNYTPEPNETDLDGNPRIINSQIDMGPYELPLPTPTDLLDDLTKELTELGLPTGTENSLLAKLDTALQKLEDDNQNNDQAAINLLEAFINLVEAQAGKNIAQSEAEILIQTAQYIIDMLSSG